jgi:nucleotide-binding universal stress UspA family protein
MYQRGRDYIACNARLEQPIAEDHMTTLTAPRPTFQQWQYETPALGGIIVGFDGSPGSRNALHSAAAIAAANRWPVHVVSVLPPMSSYTFDPRVDQPPSEIDNLRVQLRNSAMVGAIRSAARANEWTHEVLVGSPAEELADVAERRFADLIIVGRTHRGTIERLLSGETTLQVMRYSRIPVLVVGEWTNGPATVVAAIDLSPASVRAAAVGLEMLGESGTFYLVHVEQPPQMLAEGLVLPRGADYSAQLTARLNQLKKSLRVPNGVVAETIVLDGSTPRAIMEFSDRVGADLITAGTHGLSGIARFLLGSVSTALVRQTEKSILIVPPKA